MGKKIESEQWNDIEVPTSINLPQKIKEDCRRSGIKFKRCFLVGYHQLKNDGVGQTQKNNKEIEELKQGNDKLQKKITELSLKIYDLEQKMEAKK
jgi:cell division protein FtsB